MRPLPRFLTWLTRGLPTTAGVSPPPGEKAHLFRHTYAVGQIDRGTSVAELRVLLGHENIATTSQYLRLTADGLHHTARATAENELLTRHRRTAS